MCVRAAILFCAKAAASELQPLTNIRPQMLSHASPWGCRICALPTDRFVTLTLRVQVLQFCAVANLQLQSCTAA